jgi:hypothetical protein
MKQIITWTALPNGIGKSSVDGTTTVLRLSVRATPRLTPDGGSAPIGSFSDFVDWAGKPWSFSVLFGNYPPSGPATPTVAHLKPAKELLRPNLWKRFFQGPETVVVRNRTVRDLSNPVVRSFPASRILDFIKRQYSTVAIASPTELPAPGNLYGRGSMVATQEGIAKIADFSALDLSHFGARASCEKTIHSLIKGGVVPHSYPASISDSEATRLDFWQAEYFHAPKIKTKDPDKLEAFYLNKPAKPDLDFHQIIAMLGDYPELLKLLGLIFDLEVPVPPGMAGIADKVVRVWPENPLSGGPDSKVALGTGYDFDLAGGIFSAHSSGSLVVKGHLDMSGKDFSVAQVDIDGSAIKAINFTQTLGDLGIHKQPVLGTPKTAGLPALRSGGMSVLMDDRASGFVQKLKNGSSYESKLSTLDIRGEVSFSPGIRFSAEDLVRGYRVDVYDETKKQWRSLCKRTGTYTYAPDPSVTIFEKDHLEEGTVTVAGVSSTDPAAGSDLYLHEALFHWDGWSLVLPHPGKTIEKPAAGDVDTVGYQPTDVANAIGLTTSFKVAAGSLPKLRYGNSYRIRARLVDIAGNSRNIDEDKDDTGATSAAPYLRFEPVASPALASSTVLRPGESVDRLVIRSWAEHETTPTDETSGRVVIAPRATVQLAELHGMIDGPAPDGASSWYTELANRDKAQVPDTINPGETMDEAPYLPDPAASGAAFVGLQGADVPLVFRAGFDGAGSWPHSGTFRIELQEGEAGYEWFETERKLVVRLPKAGRITVPMSSCLTGPGMLDQMGIWQWIRESAPAAWLEKLAKVAVEGRHWMITPFRELTFIHAVQHPLFAPEVQGASPLRNAGETFFTLAGILHVHGGSTDKVDFRATWNDVLSAPDSAEGFALAERSADACRFEVTDTDAEYASLSVRHELGDTRHRKIAYRATATSRFREYFETDESPEMSFTTPQTLERPADFVLDVPSSARPLAPKIEYIIPTFEWEEHRQEDGLSRRRGGGNLRVYMSGEWFSSGEGELLGVLVAHGPQIVTADGFNAAEVKALGSPTAPVPPEKLQHYVSQWGIDPIWLSGLVHQTPTVHHFPAAVARSTDLLLEENPPIPPGEPRWGVAAAGHPVAYDPERKLWYSDIDIDAGPSYYPFVRLALARFQPCSVAGMELSRVFTADCVQTTPDRLLWTSPDPANPFGVKVSLSGLAPRACFNVVCPNRVIVRIEVGMPGNDSTVWVPVDEPWVPLAEMQVSKTVTVWSGYLLLPQVRNAQRYRLVVEEYEFLNADPGRGLDNNSATSLRAMAGVGKTAVWPRMVYSDVVELDPPLGS